MKNIYLLLVFCLVAVAGYAQSSWQWVSPAPQGNDIYASQLLEDGTAYMGGAFGTLLKSTGYGDSWTEVEYDFRGDVRSLFFVNPDTGFVVTSNYDSSWLYKTTNGGLDWQSTVFPQMWINVVWFMDDTTGFLGGDWGLIMKTTNGGNSWIDAPFSETWSYVRFSALNPLVIYASARDGAIIKSVDGGLTWDEVISGIGDYPFVHHFDEMTGIYTGGFDTRILKTYNGGSTWWPKTNDDVYATSMNFFNSTQGVVSSRNGDIRHTTDQGETWQLTPSVIPTTNYSWFTTASFSSMEQGIMGGLNGLMAMTADGGVSLTQTSTTITGDNLMGLFFLNDSTLYAGSDHGKIFKTTNRWITWDTLSLPFDANVYKISFPTAFTGYALAWWEEFRVYKTTDGGLTWQQLLSGDLYDIEFSDENTGIVTSGNGILRTTDGGATWVLFPTSPEYRLELMSFADANTGYVSGFNNENRGIIYKTTNGGLSWQVVTTEPPGLIALKAVTADTVYAATLLGWFYQSSDGGVTWDSDDNFTEAGIHNVHNMNFFDTNRGVCSGTFGSGGVIAETNDGGNTWTMEFFTQHYLNDVLVLPASATWYVTGQLGTLLRRSDTTAVAAQNIPLPRQTLTISPNPASGIITIGLPGCILTNPSITIFNSQGQCVYSAQHSAPTLNISFLKQGVYFLRVSSGEDFGGGVLVVD